MGRASADTVRLIKPSPAIVPLQRDDGEIFIGELRRKRSEQFPLITDLSV